MPISPLNLSSLSTSLAQFKGQALTSLFNQTAPAWPAGQLTGTSADTHFFDRTGNALLDAGSALAPADALAGMPQFGSMLDQFSASLRSATLPTSTTPTGLDASQSFSKPGQNMVTVLNRVEVTFKAQFAELGEMRTSLVHEQDAAQKFHALGPQSSNADITAAVDQFVAAHNAGVSRYAPEVAAGGILEGSWEAQRALFATDRDIDYILNGADTGVKNGSLAALGITTDPKTGLAAVDQAQLDAALAKDQGHAVAALNAFGGTFATTVDFLNAADHAQSRQMGNLDRAVHWIDANKADVQKEFGPGAAATPDDAFAKAAARYDAMAKLIAQS
jgi:hypothetical protein